MPTIFSRVFEYGFVPSFANENTPMCLLCEKTFNKDAMKQAKMRNQSEMINSDKENKDVEYFKMRRQKLKAQLNFYVFIKSSVGVDNEGGLKTSYSISLNIGKED